MSNDLISRSAVLKIIEDIKRNNNVPKNYGTLLGIMREIRELPTAYDVDKVVGQLDKASDYYECEEQGREHVQMVDLTEAIEIVRAGGINEKLVN